MPLLLTVKNIGCGVDFINNIDNSKGEQNL